MTDNFRVMFAGLADNVDSKTACTTLAAKLKISEEKVALFFKGKPLFAPSDKNKALKQAIFDALDYITSSLIRLEEKLEDLEQRLPENQTKNPEVDEDEWQDEELLLDEELITQPKKRSNALLYSLIATVVTLLIILAVYLAFPALFAF